MGQAWPSCKQPQLLWSWAQHCRPHKSPPGRQGEEGERRRRGKWREEERLQRERRRERREKRENRKNMRSAHRGGSRTEQVKERMDTHTHTHTTLAKGKVRDSGKGPPSHLRTAHSLGLRGSQPCRILAAAGTSCPRKLAARWPLGGPSCFSSLCRPLPSKQGPLFQPLRQHLPVLHSLQSLRPQMPPVLQPTHALPLHLTQLPHPIAHHFFSPSVQ